jgi:hypothetical protein
MTKPDMQLWLSDARGVYIPRDFAKCFIDRDTRDRHVKHVDAEYWATLEYGPEHEYYWETWDSVLNNARVVDENGVEFSLYQDGDLWLVPVGMEWDEDTETYVWPNEDETTS